MSSLLVTLIAAGTLGFLHALEVDHMIAVSAFVSGRPPTRAAAIFGARWGVGHGVAVLLLGSGVILTGIRWPDRYDAWGEGAVGVMLVLVGAWALHRARKLHLHRAEAHGDHVHLHAHGAAPDSHQHTHRATGPSSPHHHGHGITLVGLLHGLAGSSAVVALIPVTFIESKTEGVIYLLAFGVGTTLGMTLFAVLAAGAMRQAAEQSIRLGRTMSTGVGLAGIVVGAYWIWAALSTG
jgi:ABC-type nickel/cobalt efflux system permease component RcnA